MEFPDGMTLGEARALLRKLVDEGHECPLCTQYAKVYRRLLSHVPAAAMVVLRREHGREWAHLPTLLQRHLPEFAHQGGYATLAAHWSLIEEEIARRDDGGRAGWWRITDLGEQWLRGEITVPRYARLYAGRCLGLTGDCVSIRGALGERFDYAELMGSGAAAASDALFEPAGTARRPSMFDPE